MPSVLVAFALVAAAPIAQEGWSRQTARQGGGSDESGSRAAGGTPKACVVSNGTLAIARFSTVGGGKLLPGFLFLQGESDGLSQELGVNIGGGRGSPIPFEPDDSCDAAIFDGASPDLRSPQL